jgi:hypothetical protein
MVVGAGVADRRWTGCTRPGQRRMGENVALGPEAAMLVPPGLRAASGVEGMRTV